MGVIEIPALNNVQRRTAIFALLLRGESSKDERIQVVLTYYLLKSAKLHLTRRTFAVQINDALTENIYIASYHIFLTFIINICNYIIRSIIK